MLQEALHGIVRASPSVTLNIYRNKKIFRTKIVEKNESRILYPTYASESFKIFEITQQKGANEPLSTLIYVEQ
jgi:hypothetical protein